MMFTWFATFHDTDDPACSITEDEHVYVCEIVAETEGLRKGLVYTPWPIDGLPHQDGPPPQLQVQLYFDNIKALEAAVGVTGALQKIATLPSLTNANVTQQAMLARDFFEDPTLKTASSFCTYVVHYPGPADDFNHWLAHYLSHHVPILKRFPKVRGVEVCTRLDWQSALPWQRVKYMQRNKVVFDDAKALKAALSSPIMDEMRAGSSASPSYQGGNSHYPMRTTQIVGPLS